MNRMKLVQLRSPCQLTAALMTAALMAARFVPGLFVSTMGEGIQIGTNVTIRFASVEAGRELLIRRDEFIAALTPLDRRARLQVVQDVSEKDFLA